MLDNTLLFFWASSSKVKLFINLKIVIMKVHFNDTWIPFKLQFKKKIPETSETFKLKSWGQPDSKVNQRSAFI